MKTATGKAKVRKRIARAALGVMVVGGVIAIPLSAGAAPSPRAAAQTVQERVVSGFGKVLVDHRGFSLYELSTESKGVLHCKSKTCVAFWPPLVVAANSKITVGPGVKGKISHVSRGSKWQVTDNGYPLYTFSGDSGPRQSHGEGISSFGGTWYLLKAGATTNPSTPDKVVSPGVGAPAPARS